MAERSQKQPAGRGPGRPFQKGAPSPNPGGRPKKTDEMREAEELLRLSTPDAARRLLQLEQSADENVALKAVLGHLKLTYGERLAVDMKDSTPKPAWQEQLEQLSAEEILRVARGR